MYYFMIISFHLHVAACGNRLNFGDFAVGETRQINFTLNNHGSKTIKFQWPNNVPGLTFSPNTGHLNPSKSKDISVYFKAEKPVTLKQEKATGKIWKIKYPELYKQVF